MIIYFLLRIGIVFFCVRLAQAKGYNDKIAFVLGVFFHVFALLYYGFMPTVEKKA